MTQELTVCLDGRLVDPAGAVVPVTDRGFLYGDSVYEVLRIYQGHPFALAAHFERLERSAKRLQIDLSAIRHPLRQDVARCLEAAGHDQAYVRIMVTRGSGVLGLDPALADRPRRVILVAPFTPLPLASYEEGVSIQLVATGRAAGGTLDQGAKSGNYLVHLLALGEARRQGAHEAVLMAQDGRITEGATSNLFAVVGGELLTPPLSVGILEGITRRQVVALAREAALPVREATLTAEALRGADELFLTSTLREVLPVTRVGEQLVARGRPGPVSRQLLTAYRARVADSLGGPEG